MCVCVCVCVFRWVETFRDSSLITMNASVLMVSKRYRAFTGLVLTRGLDDV